LQSAKIQIILLKHPPNPLQRGNLKKPSNPFQRGNLRRDFCLLKNPPLSPPGRGTILPSFLPLRPLTTEAFFEHRSFSEGGLRHCAKILLVPFC